MKKGICLLLLMTLCLGLVACTATQIPTEPSVMPTEAPPVEPWLEAGFGSVKFTPNYSVGLDGSGNAESRLSIGRLDHLYMTCVALKDETDKIILVFTVDTLGMSNSVLESLRDSVFRATGIPPAQIFCGSTHTHSSPALSSKTAGEKFMNDFYSSAAEAATLAVADLSTATLHATTTDLEGMNFVRHYKMSDGSYAGPNFGTFEGLEIVDYAGTVDPELSLIKLEREGDKEDILMINWQSHPNNSAELGYYMISADFVGALRTELQDQTGMHIAYFTGASGNVHINSRIESDSHGLNWREYGEKLASLTIEAMSGLKPVGGTGIETVRLDYVARIDHSIDDMVGPAQEVYDVWKTKGKAAGDALALTYGFSSVYQAKTIVERAPLADLGMLEMCAFRVGDLGFTTGTYEMFSEAGMYVKDNSPFEVTFIITGNRTYFPTEEAFDYRCYESDTSYYVRGTSEAMAEKYVEMLKEVE